jgi:hypothetical protein
MKNLTNVTIFSGYMIDNIEEKNVNEDMSSYNPRRVQDEGYKDRARNQILQLPG